MEQIVFDKFRGRKRPMTQIFQRQYICNNWMPASF